MSFPTSITAVMRSSYAQIITVSGNTSVTYKSYNEGISNAYGEPVVSYSSYTITASVQPIDEKDVMFREPGFKADDHSKIYLIHNTITPKYLDHYTCQSIEYEVRYVMPRSLHENIVHYEVIGRRLSS